MSSRRNASVVVALGVASLAATSLAAMVATSELLAESFDRPAGRDDEPSGGSPCPDRHHPDRNRPGRDRDGHRHRPDREDDRWDTGEHRSGAQGRRDENSCRPRGGSLAGGDAGF